RPLAANPSCHDCSRPEAAPTGGCCRAHAHGDTVTKPVTGIRVAVLVTEGPLSTWVQGAIIRLPPLSGRPRVSKRTVPQLPPWLTPLVRLCWKGSPRAGSWITPPLSATL